MIGNGEMSLENMLQMELQMRDPNNTDMDVQNILMNGEESEMNLMSLYVVYKKSMKSLN